MWIIRKITFVFICYTCFIHHASSTQESLSIYIDDVDFTFINIPRGSFLMGSNEGQKDELPIHPVNIKSFYLQSKELTLKQFSIAKKITTSLKGSGCWYFDSGWKFNPNLDWSNPGYLQDELHPVVCVSWVDTQKYIDYLNMLLDGYQLRLPSEAEWEYAARAGSQYAFYWGKNPQLLCTHANASDLSTLKKYPSFKSNRCDDGYITTAPVATYLPSPYQLYDVYGNVWEWTQDCWNKSYKNAPGDGSAWLEGDCQQRVYRGGGWGDNPKFANSSLRNRAKQLERRDDIGIRLVLEKSARH